MEKPKNFLESTKVKVAAVSSALLSAPALFAGDAPVIPTTPLKADYALFDYVFAGVIAVAFIFMIAGRVKSFIK
ncbi:phosphonate transporter [Campylobacter concisus]|uniref:phosphonate transporter n=1 Tax=Campylobacter concisus TaxID=199 RepID=UPI000CD7FBB6|nr:phosphonate transporter [Campylobacter concisus]